MQAKKAFFTELAYLLGLISLAFGAALMQRADFGMSMVVAPAYLLHLKLSQIYPWFSFGMAEYALQAVLLVVLGLLLRRFRFSYLISLGTAVLYGFMLDGMIALVALMPGVGVAARCVFYASGLVMSSLGVSLLFHTYIPPEAYELFVKEVSARAHMDINRFKTLYDCVSCLVGVMLSFAFFGLWHFEGVKLGTILCALINGFLIGRISHGLEAVFQFRDALSLREKLR